MQREQPWHFRRITEKHEQLFRDLADLHELTLSWLRELRAGDAQLITRGLRKNVAENLWMLDSFAPGSEGPLSGEAGLEALADETMPEDVLGRLEHTVWAVQAWTLSQLLKEAGGDAGLWNTLEQASWAAGRRVAERRWPDLAERHSERGPARDLRPVLLALNDSPATGLARGNRDLVRRATATEVRLELRACPHGSLHPEVERQADELCRLHHHWTRGFVYPLQSQAVLEPRRNPVTGRCEQRWHFLP